MLRPAYAGERPRAISLSGKALALTMTAVVLAIVGFETVRNPDLNRFVLALVIAAGLCFVGVRRPGAAVVLTFAFLVLLGLIRRLLIPIAGWNSYDPLLLVAPVVSGFLLARVFLVHRRRLAPDLFSRLVFAFLVLVVLEAFNPLGIGLLAGVVGLLFIAAPLLWFFVGREVADQRTVSSLLRWVVVLGLGSATYGLWQTTNMPPWDVAWFNAGGYTALQVSSEVSNQLVVRAFGTFSSSSEYATYLGMALVIALAMVLRGRLLALAAAPLIASALLLDSSRGVVLLVLLAVLLLIGLRTSRPLFALAVVASGLLALFLVVRTFGPALEQRAVSSGNPLIIHQVSGLLHPFDPDQSTLNVHWIQLVDGLRGALHKPLGVGTSVITRPDKFGSAANGPEGDLPAAIVGIGLPGGVLFVAIFVGTFWMAVSGYWRRRELSAFCVPAILLVTFYQWLNGGQYAVAPLIWFLIGWTTHESTRRLEASSSSPMRVDAA